jgi:protocatechuate 3,4-dioxygenase alpha subunit
MKLPPTPSQTVGPYFKIGLTWADGAFVVPEGTQGAFWIRGRVLDGLGEPIPDALVETWQADPKGSFDHAVGRGAASESAAQAFRGYGRAAADGSGRYGILTLKPGAVPAPDGSVQAPHVDVSVFARGLLKRVVTRIYFEDEVAANASDPVLSGFTDPAARDTLMARRTSDGYSFDIRLQGDGETVFFDL